VASRGRFITSGMARYCFNCNSLQGEVLARAGHLELKKIDGAAWTFRH